MRQRSLTTIELIAVPSALLLSRMGVTTSCHPDANIVTDCEKLHHAIDSLCLHQRIHAAELARLLNSAKQPIYVLDEDLTIVFLNRACQEWLGTGESLVGPALCLSFQPHGRSGSTPWPPACARRRRSCRARASSATVSRMAEDGRLIERRAQLPADRRRGRGRCWASWPSSTRPTNRRIPPRDDRRCRDVDEAGPIALHEHVRRFRQEAAARYRADRLIGQGPAMRLARRQVELAAASRSSVLLVGPPGSGRQHLAAAIHYGAEAAGTSACRRIARRTLAPLDCSLLGADLLEAVARGRRAGESAGRAGRAGHAAAPSGRRAFGRRAGRVGRLPRAAAARPGG